MATSDEERIRAWKLQLQREMAEDDDDEHDDGQAELIARYPMPAPVHFDDDPLSDEESGGASLPSGAHAVDDDFGLDLEEPAYRDKAPAHPAAFELPKGVPKTRDGYADPAAVATQAHLDTMQAALHERDIEIQRLRRAASTEPEGVGRPDDLRDQRLRELAKKNRQLVQIVGKERAQNAVLASEVASLKAGQSSQQPPQPTAGVTTRPASSASAARASQAAVTITPLGGSDDARELRAKLALANTKLNELRQTEQAMRAELAKYQRALAKEVGDDVPLSKAVDEAGGWRGRAQQITLLKAKLSDLRRSASAAGVGSGETTINAVEERARTQIASKEQDRRREFERLVLREQELHNEKAEVALRLEATQARVKILETEGRALREKLKLLLGKSDDDDELIQALKEQLNKASEQGAARRSSPQARRGAAEAAASAASAEALAELNAAKDELAQQCDRQEQIIMFLRDQLSRQSVVKESETPAASPHELRVLENENAKLRELCQLLQDKLSRAIASQPTRPPTE